MLNKLQRLLYLILSLLVVGCGRQAPTERALTDLFPTSTRADTQNGDEEWTTAVAPRPFRFPTDHSAHEDYRIEWWYYTGNVETEDGRRFGYQLTFFRTGLHKQPDNPSRWAVRDLYTAHFGVSDIAGKRHFCFQRNSRRGIGQAAARSDRYEVWNGDWKVWLDRQQHRLQAANGEIAIDFTLSPIKPLVLHGDSGLSQKGPSTGNASHYYSFTRLATEGTIRVGEDTFPIKGNSWMDHEFSTSFLEPGQLGWDWLSIQLDDGVDLMLYQMRRDDGTIDPFSSGSLIDRSGVVQHLSADDYELTPLETWKSDRTGAQYPLKWRINIPSHGYEFEVHPALASQEMTTGDTTGISYWEGAIDIEGQGPDGKVTGSGYMELTGYVGQGLGSLFD